jgi:hypothetical protein
MFLCRHVIERKIATMSNAAKEIFELVNILEIILKKFFFFFFFFISKS